MRNVILLLAAIAAFAFPGLAQARTLKIATIVPDGSAWMQEMRAMAEVVKAKTDGRVRFKFYPGGVMGNDKTVMRKIRAGQLQGAAFTSGALAGIYPDIDLYGLPLVFRTYAEVDYVRARMDDVLTSGLEAKGFVALAISDGGFAYLMSQRPMRAVSDLKGAKVWIQEGDVMGQTAFRAAGVSGVQLPMADVYTSLQTGLIDTLTAPSAGAIALQWHSKVKYVTDFPLTYLIGVFAVDARAFGKLSEADQKITIEAVQSAAQRLDASGRESDANARQALVNQGIEFLTPASEEELERWQAIQRDTLAELRARGIYTTSTIDAILGYLQQFREGSGN